MFCAPQTFRPRLRVWPKRTFKGETDTNCRVALDELATLSKYVDCMWNMTKWNSHSCFCLLADPYTWASMHSEWDLNAKKTVQEIYYCVLQGLPLLHSLCVENWLSPLHCDLINYEVTVGVIRFSVFFYWYGISVPKSPSRYRTERFPD